MVKKWRGSYKYNSEKIQNLIGHPCTFFTIEMEVFDDDTLKGIVEDDTESGGMNGTGEVVGEIHKNSIYFEKQMPYKSTIVNKKGLRETHDEKHPLLTYEGELVSANKYKGTWSFEKTWGFMFGFIPIKFNPGKGTWEMELDTE